MTERTIEVEQTETVEEQFFVCDHCGLEVSDDGVQYLPFEAATTATIDKRTQINMLEMGLSPAEFRLVKVDEDHELVHYHDDCLERATIGEYEPVRAWNEMEDAHGNRVLLAMAWPEITLGIASLALVLGSGTLASWPLNFIGPAVGIGLLLASLIVGSRQASNPIEELNGR